ncbi:hypothetical protein IGS73_10570 [Janibacter indicus]|uniref:Uncharacterized protein n=1 Tax=Janibacter indicus TaxID=857417 RepID=A0A1L3MH37_9MICO|nr:hypothetical protein [Janibacter indicus]APH01679.1 hypothetical protein ASJ30_09180 [Janibacter indicus]QOK21601.1 hypothetical protein IGS73_10570 [Janibacter indicus]
MTTTVHVTHFFTTASPHVLDECDLLMDELMELEEADSSVRDAAVSADSDQGIVEVEVLADGYDESDAQRAAVARIRAAVARVVPLRGSMRQRDVTAEPVPC